MVTVKIRHVGVGVLGASGLALLGQASLGCAAQPVEPFAGSSAADTTADPGSGTLSLTGYWAGSAENYSFVLSKSTTDEFVRVGEALSFDVPGYYVWNALHADDPQDLPDVARLEGLKISVDVQFIHEGEVVGRASVPLSTWTGESNYEVTGHSDAFVVPPKVDTLAVGMTIADPVDGAHVELATLDFATVPVFGGELPLKHAIFDNDYSALRQRIVEGGSLVAGTSSVFTYSDWRADEIVDKTSIDTQIGTVQSYGRFGPVVVPIYGDLAYVVTAGFTFDGQSWATEVAMPATTTSRVVEGPGRTAYETSIYVPTNAAKIDMFFHVRAYLVVDYTRYGNNVVSKKYAQGDRVLVRDRYDNMNGQAYSNYELPVGAP